MTGAAFYSVADNGNLVFISGDANIAESFRRHSSRCSDARPILTGLLADFDAYHPEGCRAEFVAMVVRATE